MEQWVDWVLTPAAALLAIPVLVFLVEIAAAVTLPRPRRGEPSRDGVCVTALVPAHNESRGILPTIADIHAQLRPGDRLLVVADNCTDDTAAVAAGAGAEVVERHDPERRGKGYALDFGVRHLDARPPDIVIVVDADCRLGKDTIERLAALCMATGRSVQALYLMSAPESAGISLRIAEFAWRVKNRLRPAGLAALGLPCQLAGTGMAFPWKTIRSANLASGEIVEDLKLGLDLAAAGHAPVFCPAACVTSEFPTSAEGAASQRQRWEQGHISTILRMAPALLCQGVLRRDWKLFALALDLAVPPLSLLAVLVLVLFVLTVLLALLGFPTVALVVSTANLLAFFLAAGIAWLKTGRDVLPGRLVWSIIPYVLGKFGLYRQIFSGRSDKKWVRTDRNSK